MQAVAKAHEKREECFLQTILDKIKARNESCTPTFFQNYKHIVMNTTEWCSNDKTGSFFDIFTEVYQKDCPTPCSRIKYEHSNEPFHGGDNSFTCGRPANIINIVLNEKVEVEKVNQKQYNVILRKWIRQLFILMSQEEYVMTWDDLLSNLGGALGLWLGFSAVSIVFFCLQSVRKIGHFNIFK